MGALLGSAAALGFVELYSHPSMRVWLLAGPLVYVVYLLGRARAERLTRRGRRVRGAAELQQSIARLLSRAIASGNDAAERRLWRVQRVCVAVGERLELREKELDALASAALLHDVGKLSVPDLILSKPGRLDEHEMEQIRIHPVLGAEIVRRIGFPSSVECVVRHHHERWNPPAPRPCGRYAGAHDSLFSPQCMRHQLSPPGSYCDAHPNCRRLA